MARITPPTLYSVYVGDTEVRSGLPLRHAEKTVKELEGEREQTVKALKLAADAPIAVRPSSPVV